MAVFAIVLALSLGQTDLELPERLLQRPSSRSEVAAVCHHDSAWWKANGSSPPGVTSCEVALRTLATDAHDEAQRNKRRAFYLLASQRYRAYLTLFGSGPLVSDQAFNLTYYLAEVLWALDAFEEAITEYQRVVAFEIPDRESAREISNERYRDTAEVNIVLAWGKLVQRERGLLPSRGEGGFSCEKPKALRPLVIGARRVELSRAEHELVRTADEYRRRHVGEPSGASLLYDSAVILAERGHLKEAGERLQSLIERYQHEPEASHARRLLQRLRLSRE